MPADFGAGTFAQMERAQAQLIQLLEAAKQKARHDEEHIQRQRQILETLVATGSETAEALRLLRSLEEIQDNHLADVNRILNELDKA
jgi:hypothetical protein